MLQLAALSAASSLTIDMRRAAVLSSPPNSCSDCARRNSQGLHMQHHSFEAAQAAQSPAKHPRAKQHLLRATFVRVGRLCAAATRAPANTNAKSLVRGCITAPELIDHRVVCPPRAKRPLSSHRVAPSRGPKLLSSRTPRPTHAAHAHRVRTGELVRRPSAVRALPMRARCT